ncbi:NAD-dependent succinate-semialdehyde dehydrogenase [Mycolicibacterium poriferae]|uniref:NAD-dependent succinate-semialdehyde dehydrogenase n=1 Tax=Mycolicibacterium poriferae TaxID=39694 RepID=A0A6N4V2S2_9MYCO|nr:NAD-dependent succinate-semialdehyde dehydrogenase [Mycolicibacterium poriferae]MAS04143.1 NAD-dependent succinate-semialdehyde dehydrogenase [Ahrensia sp.]MCV7262498.1 NAD-dependent succinate-semialdehyde dehydrogenase [Mycolicibacterium poriferae]BBX49215.1 NAD-dependent succinate-semialdehyde dehydrogenase [Mycolicibacterium poriferae]
MTATPNPTPPQPGVTGIPTGLLIGAGWRDASDGKVFEVECPATGEVLATVADGGPADADDALAGAVAAQASWARTAPRYRSEILRRAYDLVMARQDWLAEVMTLEMGKPLAEAKGEVAYAAEFLRWFSEEAVRISGDHTTTGDGGNRIIVTREPVGPCVLITPWNFPLAMGTRKIAPAVAAGCTMVLKPAPQTPLTSLALAAILQESGLPEGVLNIINTTDAATVVQRWMSSGKARKISFTGSTAVGKVLLRQAADAVMRSSMELGGNAPFIVCADADVDTAVEGAVSAKMRNMGEACTAANRMYVHRDIAREFSERLAARMAELNVGNGLDEGVQVGPLIDAAARSKVQRLVDDALSRGATALTGGRPVDGPGYFYPPTVLADVAPDSDLMTTEVFGPVAPVIPFVDEDEAVARANDTDWGLVGYLFTQDIDRAFDLSERLEVGMVGVNTGVVSNPAAPFGGIKQSGLGREGGKVGIDEFLEYKYLSIPRRRGREAASR